LISALKITPCFRRCHYKWRPPSIAAVQGFADRAERKVIDKIVDGLKFHSGRVGPINSKRLADVRFEASCKDVSRHDQEG
jgi:hypothetical protein